MLKKKLQFRAKFIRRITSLFRSGHPLRGLFCTTDLAEDRRLCLLPIHGTPALAFSGFGGPGGSAQAGAGAR